MPCVASGQMKGATCTFIDVVAHPGGGGGGGGSMMGIDMCKSYYAWISQQ